MPICPVCHYGGSSEEVLQHRIEEHGYKRKNYKRPTQKHAKPSLAARTPDMERILADRSPQIGTTGYGAVKQRISRTKR